MTEYQDYPGVLSKTECEEGVFTVSILLRLRVSPVGSVTITLPPKNVVEYTCIHHIV